MFTPKFEKKSLASEKFNTKTTDIIVLVKISILQSIIN